MASGMETLFATLLKSMGFDPVELANSLNAFLTGTNETLIRFETQSVRIETKIDRVLDKLDAAFPSVPYAACEVDETLSAIIVPISVTLEIKDAA